MLDSKNEHAAPLRVFRLNLAQREATEEEQPPSEVSSFTSLDANNKKKRLLIPSAEADKHVSGSKSSAVQAFS